MDMIFDPSPNFDERDGPVSVLVMHYTGMPTAHSAITLLKSPRAKVSAHYVVDEDGTVYNLVPEAKRAWHAGISYWRGQRMLNDASVGIEIVNPGHEWGYRPFPAAQMQAARALAQGIIARHSIAPRNVVAHSDIAPNRKQDPGELFGWAWLAEHGVGVWTEASDPPGDLRADLAAIGYDIGLPEKDVILAFQRHFLPNHLSGLADEPTGGRAAALRRLVDGQGNRP
ncbi:N-acetylmuramoyl-L-alanine amidase [Acidocella aminolytica]|uniref:N-acetylmuramoyl-L-alanine amidase n=2 Tax=Acidocella TaxID=50709 RepID=A0A0D6PHR3_9PROT|nr:N-acetylmuramoyl-L-alanine amidase [Acidocella aminolytica 101 = DSM 11237]GBQ37994.1 N-acetylmuramoyl-L-alanine amidase [Acidocella aminolytica 101 = DSM 11237]